MARIYNHIALSAQNFNSKYAVSSGILLIHFIILALGHQLGYSCPFLLERDKLTNVITANQHDGSANPSRLS